MKCYIDVNFTIEEDFTRFSDEDIVDFVDNRELVTALFKKDLLERLKYFSHNANDSGNIKDLEVTVTFEDRQ